MLLRILLTLATASCSSFALADTYSCTGPGGRSVLQSRPCKSAIKGSSSHLRPAHVDLNLPTIARKKCIESGYDAENDTALAKCTDELRQTMYKRICEEAGRGGVRLDACLYNLRSQDDQYGKRVQLDYYCVAHDKAFGTSQYKACSDAVK